MKSWNNIDDLTDERPPIDMFGNDDIKQTTFQFWLDRDERFGFGLSWQTLNVSKGHYNVVDDLINNFTLNFEYWYAGWKAEMLKQKAELERRLENVEEYDISQHKDERVENLRKIINEYGDYLSRPYASSVRMTYDNITKRMVITFNKDLIRGFRFSSHLNYMLGFKNNLGEVVKFTKDIVDGKYIADYPVNFAAGANSLFVYTDVIQPNIVSNKMARLLRIVNGMGEYGTYISKAYNKPYYMPITANNITSIEIELKDEMDRHIKFSFGITIARLHFQRKRAMFPTIS
jgi:hypothetical protein